MPGQGDGSQTMHGSPGPGSYEHGFRPDGTKHPQWALGTSAREKLVAKVLPGSGPGPANYTIKGSIGAGPRFTMQGALTERAQHSKTGDATQAAQGNPGPGYYEHGFRPDAPKHPQWGLGTTAREKLVAKVSPVSEPGPGSYNMKSGIGSGLSYSGARESRRGATVGTNPGPGTYEHGDRPDAPAAPRCLMGRMGPYLSHGSSPRGTDHHVDTESLNKAMPNSTSRRSTHSVPGPGSYNLGTMMGTGPKHTMSPVFGSHQEASNKHRVGLDDVSGQYTTFGY